MKTVWKVIFFFVTHQGELYKAAKHLAFNQSQGTWPFNLLAVINLATHRSALY